MTERELQDKFVLWLKENKKETQHIYEEVDCMWGMTDVILYDGRKSKWPKRIHKIRVGYLGPYSSA